VRTRHKLHELIVTDLLMLRRLLRGCGATERGRLLKGGYLRDRMRTALRALSWRRYDIAQRAVNEARECYRRVAWDGYAPHPLGTGWGHALPGAAQPDVAARRSA
jgi:hypothetical protein